MDGHGRFSSTLNIELEIILGIERSNKIEITLVDNFTDKNGRECVTDYHKNMEFDMMTSIQGNIFNSRPDKNTFIYLNFCGIGSRENVIMLFDWLDKVSYYENIMLSFSNARCAKKVHYLYNTDKILNETEYYNKGWQKNRLKKWKSIQVAINKKYDFVTYRFMSKNY